MFENIYNKSTCEQPIVVLVSTKEDPEDVSLPSSTIEKANDFIRSTAKRFGIKKVYLFGEILRTFLSRSEGRDEDHRFDAFRDIISGLTTFSNSLRGFYIPLNWESLGRASLFNINFDICF